MHKCFNNIIYFDCLDSSNDYLIDLYKNFSIIDPLTIYVDKQKKGRGSMGKKWFSGKAGLTFSFSIKISEYQQPFTFNMLTTLSLFRLLRDLDIQAYIKYPNDIIVNNKKIAGALTEIINIKGQKYAIIGVGLNVNNVTFPQTIPHATSLYQLLSNQINKDDLFRSLIIHIKDFMTLNTNQKHDVQKLYFKYLQGTNDYVLTFFRGEKVFLKILHLNSQGVLTIQERDSLVVYTVASTELKFLLI